MTTALVESYRLAREAQDARFDGYARGAATGTQTPEYRSYFGLGEYAGQGVEERVTFKAWLVGNSGQREPVDGAAWDLAPGSAFWLSNAQIAELAAAGVPGAIWEDERRRLRRAEKAAERAARREG